MRPSRRFGQAIHFDLNEAANADPHLAKLLSYSSKSLPNRFTEDVANAVMPAGLGNSDRSLSLELSPPDSAHSDMVAVALGGDHHINYAVYRFLHTCVTTVLTFGEASYEIAYDSQVNAEGRRKFYIVAIPPRSLDHRGDKMPVQRVPKHVAEARNVSREIVIPRSHLIIFEPPASIRKYLVELMERLAVLSDPLIPAFGIESISGRSKGSPFDHSVYLRTRKLAIVEASRRIGWTGGEIYGPIDQEVLEHYWWYRELVFLRFSTELRNTLLDTLNNGLARASVLAGASAQIQFVGFPTVEEIDAAILHLQVGDRPLTSIQSLLKRAVGEWGEVDCGEAES